MKRKRSSAPTQRSSPAERANARSHETLLVPFRQKHVALLIDEDVFEWFKAQDQDYPRRMTAVLRAFRNAHR